MVMRFSLLGKSENPIGQQTISASAHHSFPSTFFCVFCAFSRLKRQAGSQLRSLLQLFVTPHSNRSPRTVHAGGPRKSARGAKTKKQRFEASAAPPKTSPALSPNCSPSENLRDPSFPDNSRLPAFAESPAPPLPGMPLNQMPVHTSQNLQTTDGNSARRRPRPVHPPECSS